MSSAVTAEVDQGLESMAPGESVMRPKGTKEWKEAPPTREDIFGPQ
jgi:hypothetical protein